MQDEDSIQEFQELISSMKGSSLDGTADGETKIAQKSHSKQVGTIIILIANFVAIVCVVITLNAGSENLVTSIVTLTESNATIGWVRPKIIFGHVHMAKTAGSEINGLLSVNYERVCGNKGYSSDALQTNKRFSEDGWNMNDDIQITYPGYNRARVPMQTMQQRGFDDCDYISLEVRSVKTWASIYTQSPMEMHVPCRDPLDHLMSMANYKRLGFNCNATNLAAEVEATVVRMTRMRPEFAKSPNVTLKCFDPMPPQKYVDYMGTILQPRRLRADYVHRPTNKPRKKEKECIWKQSQEWKDNLIKLLHENYYYYEFCSQCMGSENELAL